MLTQFRFDSTALGPTTGSDIEVSFRANQTNVSHNTIQRTNFTVSADDFERFEQVLDWDSTVAEFMNVYDGPDNRIYHIEYEQGVPETLAYVAAIEHGGEFLRSYAEGQFWVNQMVFPNRQKFRTFLDRCGEFGLDVHIDHLKDTGFNPKRMDFGLTDRQREALLTAYSEGYFAVPQETSLASISDELGISESAASNRIHRGINELVENTVVYPAIQ